VAKASAAKRLIASELDSLKTARSRSA